MGPWTDAQKQAWAVLINNNKLDVNSISLCHYCVQKAVYHQPHPDTGISIDVCQKHFTMGLSS